MQAGGGGGRLKSKQCGEGALEEEDHGIIKAKLEGGLARASAGGGPHTTAAGTPSCHAHGPVGCLHVPTPRPAQSVGGSARARSAS